LSAIGGFGGYGADGAVGGVVGRGRLLGFAVGPGDELGVLDAGGEFADFVAVSLVFAVEGGVVGAFADHKDGEQSADE
jgi:hypothetical protein